MATSRDAPSKTETIIIATIERGALVEARDIVDAFHKMLRQKTAAALNPWIECAQESLIASFANGVARDEAAISAQWPRERMAWRQQKDRRIIPQPREALTGGKVTLQRKNARNA